MRTVANKRGLFGGFVKYGTVDLAEKPVEPVTIGKGKWLSNLFVLDQDYKIYKLKYGMRCTFYDFYYDGPFDFPDKQTYISARKFKKEISDASPEERANIVEWFKKELEQEEKRIKNLRDIVKVLENPDANL